MLKTTHTFLKTSSELDQTIVGSHSPGSQFAEDVDNLASVHPSIKFNKNYHYLEKRFSSIVVFMCTLWILHQMFDYLDAFYIPQLIQLEEINT